MEEKISVNKEALRLVKNLCSQPWKYGVRISKTNSGATLIDAGVKIPGSYIAGKIITEICMGGLGEVSLSYMCIKNIYLPAVSTYTNYPVISALGSQLAGWYIETDNYVAIGSGPARALALKPQSIYKKIGYADESNEAVIVLETSRSPPEGVVSLISKECGVSPRNLFIIVVPTSSVAGFVQIAGRTAETGIYRLMELGFDPGMIKDAWGCAPVLPPHPDYAESMGRSNDAILYGGSAFYNVVCEDDEVLEEITPKAVSSSSKDYGRLFSQIFKEAGMNFYRVDPKIFAPAQIVINNLRTGKVFISGEVNQKMLIRSIMSRDSTS
ncbi:methenyltetrahydromethanopterin cyclohydrolase [Candidatus Bathyarchaeota archaeon]|nr:methenyltetrahydromethanopterin cyclohydrolase [Candidatus Bathyarchaeota archaeon]